MLQMECLFLLIYWDPSPQSDDVSLGCGDVGRWWDYGGGALKNGITALLEETQTTLLSILLWENTGRRRLSLNQRVEPMTKSADTLTLDFQPPEWWELHFCCVYPPRLWSLQPKWTKMGRGSWIMQGGRHSRRVLPGDSGPQSHWWWTWQWKRKWGDWGRGPSQGVHVALRCWKRQEHESPESSGSNRALSTSWSWISDFQNCERINARFKPLLVMAPIGSWCTVPPGNMPGMVAGGFKGSLGSGHSG